MPTEAFSSQAQICFLGFAPALQTHVEMLVVLLTLPQSLSIVIGGDTPWKEWFKCISEVITEKCHWFSRYKHLAVPINKLLHPSNDCSPKQMLLK